GLAWWNAVDGAAWDIPLRIGPSWRIHQIIWWCICLGMTRGPLQDAQGADYPQRQNENMQQLEEQIRHDTLGGMKA
ncbi:MAG: hypothetical protein P8Q92_05255, partial [Pseudoprimorskyibacter sp.]|nr:hypothetical protein [Pseudoprimorskyibacter sp.]